MTTRTYRSFAFAESVLITILTLSSSSALAQPATAATGNPEVADQTTDIVVTARRREETLQDTPVAITAFNSRALERSAAGDLTALSLAVPNISIQPVIGTTNGAQIFLRGVGNDDPGFNLENSVAVYLDDVYLGRQVGSLLGVLDLDRIEVLRGPQGTLYGRNATGGAVKYVTRKPDLNEARLDGTMAFGSRYRGEAKVSASIPLISDKLAVLVSGMLRNQKGWMKIVNTANVDTGRRGNGVNTLDGRVALRWRPTEAVTVDLAADYSRNSSGPQVETPLLCPTGTTTNTLRCPPLYGLNRGNYLFDNDTNLYIGKGVSGVVSAGIGFATLKSVTAYRKFFDRWGGDLSGNSNRPLGILQRQHQSQFQQEVQLQSADTTGFFSWIVGGIYFQEKIHNDANFKVAIPVTRRNDDRQHTKSYAGFGELYFKFTPKLELTLGGRVARDRKTIDRAFYLAPTQVAPTNMFSGTLKNTEFTPKVGLSYDMGDTLIFATYSQGYRPGGFQASRPTAAAQQGLLYDVETISNYEVGVKTSPLGRLLSVDFSAFWSNYKNLQTTTIIAGQSLLVTSDVRYRGAELETTLRPLQGLSLKGTFGYLDAAYIRPPVQISTAHEPKQAPKFTYKVGFDYEFGLSDLPGAFFVASNVAGATRAERSITNDIAFQTPPYTLIDAQFGYRSASGRWSVTAGGTNLGAEQYFLAGVSNYSYHYQKPREFYLTVSTHL